MVFLVHIYQHGGEFFPSVTTIIQSTMPVPERLENWKKNSGVNGQLKMKNSQTLGTLTHYRILNKLAPNLLDPPNISLEDMPPNTQKLVDMCEIMWDRLELDIGYPRRVEKFSISKEFKYAGTPDLAAPINKIYTLADIKTSKEIYESHRLQLGGYYELLGCTPEQGMLISLHPNEHGNPHLRAHIVPITKFELELYRKHFLDLVKKFYGTNLIEKLIEDHGFTRGEFSARGE